MHRLKEGVQTVHVTADPADGGFGRGEACRFVVTLTAVDRRPAAHTAERLGGLAAIVVVKTVEIHRDGLLSVSDLPEDPESDGLIFAGWKDSEGIAASDEYQVTQDTVFTADFVRKEESVEPNYLFFSQYDAWVDLREQTFQNIVYLLPADTQYRTITWTLSDQDPADAEIAEGLHFL